MTAQHRVLGENELETTYGVQDPRFPFLAGLRKSEHASSSCSYSFHSKNFLMYRIAKHVSKSSNFHFQIALLSTWKFAIRCVVIDSDLLDSPRQSCEN